MLAWNSGSTLRAWRMAGNASEPCRVDAPAAILTLPRGSGLEKRSSDDSPALAALMTFLRMNTLVCLLLLGSRFTASSASV